MPAGKRCGIMRASLPTQVLMQEQAKVLSYKKQVAASPFFLRLISILKATNSSSGSSRKDDDGGGGGSGSPRGRNKDGCSRSDGPEPEQTPQQAPAAPEAGGAPHTHDHGAGKPSSTCGDKDGSAARGAFGGSDRSPSSPMSDVGCREGQQPQLAVRDGEGRPTPPLWQWRDCTELVAYGLGRFDSGAPI